MWQTFPDGAAERLTCFQGKTFEDCYSKLNVTVKRHLIAE